jgi:hypothetical protein
MPLLTHCFRPLSPFFLGTHIPDDPCRFRGLHHIVLVPACQCLQFQYKTSASTRTSTVLVVLPLPTCQLVLGVLLLAPVAPPQAHNQYQYHHCNGNSTVTDEYCKSNTHYSASTVLVVLVPVQY